MALGVLSAFRRLAVQSASTSGEAGSSLPLNSLIRNKLNAIFNRGSLSASQRPLATAAPPQTTATAAPTAAAVAAGQQPQYRRVPFVREDLSLVMQEVPDFKYYYIGNEAPSAYPYKDVPMDQPILNPVS